MYLVQEKNIIIKGQCLFKKTLYIVYEIHNIQRDQSEYFIGYHVGW